MINNLYRYLKFKGVIKETEDIDYKVDDKADFLIDQGIDLSNIEMKKEEYKKYDYLNADKMKPKKPKEPNE